MTSLLHHRVKLKSTNYTLPQDMEFSRTVMDQYSAEMRASIHTDSSSVCKSFSESRLTAIRDANALPSIDCNFLVLAAGFWPTASSLTVNLPRELEEHRSRFIQFYSERYQGRRLIWNQALDRCVLTARFQKGKKELEVSLFQAVVMMAFSKLSHGDTLSLTEVAEETALEIGIIIINSHITVVNTIVANDPFFLGELKRTLQSLACGIIGTRVLTKDPKGKDVNEGVSYVPRVIPWYVSLPYRTTNYRIGFRLMKILAIKCSALRLIRFSTEKVRRKRNVHMMKSLGIDSIRYEQNKFD